MVVFGNLDNRFVVWECFKIIIMVSAEAQSYSTSRKPSWVSWSAVGQRFITEELPRSVVAVVGLRERRLKVSKNPDHPGDIRELQNAENPQAQPLIRPIAIRPPFFDVKLSTNQTTLDDSSESQSELNR